MVNCQVIIRQRLWRLEKGDFQPLPLGKGFRRSNLTREQPYYSFHQVNPLYSNCATLAIWFTIADLDVRRNATGTRYAKFIGYWFEIMIFAHVATSVHASRLLSAWLNAAGQPYIAGRAVVDVRTRPYPCNGIPPGVLCFQCKRSLVGSCRVLKAFERKGSAVRNSLHRLAEATAVTGRRNRRAPDADMQRFGW